MYKFVLQKCRKQDRCLLRRSVQRAEELHCEAFRQKGPVCNYLLQTNGFHVRGGDPSDLRMSMKNSLPVNQKDPGGCHSLTSGGHVGQWFCFLFFVRDDTCHRSTGDARAFWGASFVVKTKTDSVTDNHTGATVTKDGTRTQSTCWMGKNEVDTINTHTQNKKKNLMEHFWFNFNTRLMVFSWTHCCQDVNCFGIFFFLFKT